MNILPSGKDILDRIKASGDSIPEEQAKQILEISDDEAMAAFLAANVGDAIDPDEMSANSIFSGWLMRKLNIPPMLLTLQFDNLAQAGKAIEFCKAELNREGLTAEQRNAALKVLIDAIRQRGALTKNVLQMAQITMPGGGKKVPKNKPPDTLTNATKPPQVVVQINNRVQAQGAETEIR